jgi:short-subunit dehydrogenase
MKLPETRILMTGATGGIGRATALTLLKQGASVLLVGRSDAALERLAAEYRGLGVPASRVKWAAADITRALDRSRLVDEAERLDCNVVLHNAGVPAFGLLRDASPEDLASVVQTNLVAPMALTQALLPRLLTLPAAQIVFVGSVLGSLGLPGFSVYGASKFGLHGFAQALRRELAGGPVRVQYIGPRSTDTGFNSHGVQAYNRATGTAQDRPEQVARAIARLIEDGAAERLLGFPEKLAARLNGLVPTWLDGAFRRHRQALETPADDLTAART